MRMVIEYKYAIIHIPSGFVWSRYRNKGEALAALKNIDPVRRNEFKIVSIDDPVVERYYEMVNIERARVGLPPIDPRYPNPRRRKK